MKTFKNLDFSIILIVIVFAVAVVISLPAETKEVKPFDMLYVDMLVVNADEFLIDDAGTIWYGSLPVETEMDEQAQAELFYTREEIVIRVSGYRVSILEQDNESEFFQNINYTTADQIEVVYTNGQDIFIHTANGKEIQIEIEPRKQVYEIDLGEGSFKVKFNRAKGTLTENGRTHKVYRLEKKSIVKPAKFA